MYLFISATIFEMIKIHNFDVFGRRNKNMDKEEIKDYLKRVDELGDKLTGEDKETYAWLIYGYNQCAKLLNETEQQCKKQKEAIDKITDLIKQYGKYDGEKCTRGFQMWSADFNKILDMLKEVLE